VVVDPADRLWILDTGSIKFGPTVENGPKLVCVDLNTDQVVKKIVFPRDVAARTSYLNDVRFDLRRGAAGMAFITDSTDKGPNGIVVVDLDTGRSWRRLNDHPSTKAAPNLVPTVEGEPLMMRPPAAPARRLTMGADGIAISPDGRTLYYTPLVSRHLYSVSVDALADPNASESDVAATVQDLGDRGFSSDGLEQDNQGRIYVTDYEHNAIRRRNTDGSYEIIARDPRLIWPDTLSLAADGYLYCTANQLNRQAMFHRGNDQRQRPFVLFRVRTDAQPISQR
jgi:sugar lactone lactonase YvrE